MGSGVGLKMLLGHLRDAVRKLGRSGKHQAAADLLTEHLREFPRDPAAHRELAKIRMAQGSRDVAYSLLRRAALIEQELEQEQDHAVGIMEADDVLGLQDDAAFALDREREVLTVSGVTSDASFDPYDMNPPTSVEVQEDGAVREQESPLLPSDPQPADTSTRTLTLRRRTSSTNNPEPCARYREGTPSEDEAVGPPIIVKKRRPYLPETKDVATPASAPSPEPGDLAVKEVGETQPSPRPPPSPPTTRQKAATAPSEPEEEGIEDEDDFSEPDGVIDLDPDDVGEVADDDLDAEAVVEELGGEWETADPSRVLSPSPGDSDEVDWTTLETVFDDEEDETFADEGLDEAPAISQRLEYWQCAERLALELILDSDLLTGNRSQNSTTHRLLTDIIFEGCLETRNPDKSMKARLPRLKAFLDQGVTLDEFRAAYTCRQVWAVHPEWHVDLGGAHRAAGWMRKSQDRRQIYWSVALQVARYFKLREYEEFQVVFQDLYERWLDAEDLRRRFPQFRLYVHHRLLECGSELDDLPLWTFDEPDGVDSLSLLEDDPSDAILLRAELERYGLLPDLYGSSLDLPAARSVTEA